MLEFRNLLCRRSSPWAVAHVASRTWSPFGSMFQKLQYSYRMIAPARSVSPGKPTRERLLNLILPHIATFLSESAISSSILW